MVTIIFLRFCKRVGDGEEGKHFLIIVERIVELQTCIPQHRIRARIIVKLYSCSKHHSDYRRRTL